MAVIGLGEKVRISQGYALQKSYAKDPSKRAKKMVLEELPYLKSEKRAQVRSPGCLSSSKAEGQTR